MTNPQTFQLVQATGTLKHLNIREEKHGKQKVAGLDIKITTIQSNKMLDVLSPGLRSSFYMKPKDPDGAQEIFTSNDDEGLTKLIHGALIDTLRVKREIIGGVVEIQFGGNEGSAVHIEDVKVKAIPVTLQEGGSVVLTITVQCNPASGDVDKLTQLLGREITFTLLPPSQPQADLPLDGGDDE